MSICAGVAVGAFADPQLPQPEQSVYTKDKHSWLELPEHMAAFNGGPSQAMRDAQCAD